MTDVSSESTPTNTAAATSDVECQCRLALHGAAANSRPHSLLWIDVDDDDDDDDDDDGGGDVVRRGGDEVATAAGNPSAPKRTTAIVAYASSGVVNLASPFDADLSPAAPAPSSSSSESADPAAAEAGGESTTEIASVTRTLVTRTVRRSGGAEGGPGGATTLARGEAAEAAAAARSIAALCWVPPADSKAGAGGCIIAAFSDGTLTSWERNAAGGDGWAERILVGNDPLASDGGSSGGTISSNLPICDVSAVAVAFAAGTDSAHPVEAAFSVTASALLVATASSAGVFLHVARARPGGIAGGLSTTTATRSRQLHGHASCSVLVTRAPAAASSTGDEGGRLVEEFFVFAGSASPRHNRVWVYTVPVLEGGDSPSSWATVAAMDDVPPGYRTPLLAVEEPRFHGPLLGHQDWITCFAWLGMSHRDDPGSRSSRHLLASSGHDAKVRLWRFATVETAGDGATDGGGIGNGGEDDGGGDSDEDEAVVDDLEEEEGEARLVAHHRPRGDQTTAATTSVSLEALLIGHEEAVTSLSWRTPAPGGGRRRPCLLSSSMDRTILLWMEEEAEDDGGDGDRLGGGGVWTPVSRVGSAGGMLGGPLGSSLLGFVDAAFSPGGGTRIAGHGYGGSIHFWTGEKEEDDEAGGDDAIPSRWIADPCITGHFRSAEDAAWNPDGEYLLTVGSDQTTRLWAEVPVLDVAAATAPPSRTRARAPHRWMEVGRPQVHGYDMTAVACVEGGSSPGGDDEGEPRHRFASGADEKVLRAFDAPASTLRLLRSLRRARDRDPAGSGTDDDTGDDAPATWRAERAFLPSLGLSNKATAEVDERESTNFRGPTEENGGDGDYDDDAGGPAAARLPLERDLGAGTIWPEARKLFGHDSELVCLDASRTSSDGGGAVVASACKARNDVASASIRLWDTDQGKCVGVLKGGHRSTVSTLSFSEDGRYLASSGKDRRICIWRKTSNALPAAPGDSRGAYELSSAVDSAHKRIVWSLHFCPGRPDILASGARDGFVKIWNVLESSGGALETKEIFKFEPASKKGKKAEPITAVAFAHTLLSLGGFEDICKYGIVGIGMECGLVEIWKIPVQPTGSISDATAFPKVLYSISADNCHFDSVKKLTWRPPSASERALGKCETSTMNASLASCGKDCGVRIFNLTISIRDEVPR